MKSFGIACPACHVPMSAKRIIYATRRVLHVTHACVICKAERAQYLNAIDAPAPANDTEPKPPGWERPVDFPSGPDRGN